MTHKTSSLYLIFISIAVVFWVFPITSNAEEYTSSNFKVLDPVIEIGAGRSTSSNFILLQSIGEIAVGTSTASSFQVTSGFLAFPSVTVPSATATAGDGQAALSWTASVGSLGWTVSGYNVGQSTISGGPYTYSSVGNITSSTRTGLSNGTTYYFVVRAEDAFGNSIATSTETSSTPVAAEEEDIPTPAGGWIGLIRDFFKPPIVKIPVECEVSTDMNCDGKINLQDLSIFLFLSPGEGTSPADFNDDKKVDIKDLSILFSSWTERLFAFRQNGEKPYSYFEKDKKESSTGIDSKEQLASVGQPPIDEEVVVEESEKISSKPNIIQRAGQLLLNTFKKIIGFFRSF